MTVGELREQRVPVYGLHGLRLRSPVPLAGFVQEGDAHDVDVVWTRSKPVPDAQPSGRMLAARSVGGRCLYLAADDGTAWTLRLPGLCDFVIQRERNIVECRVDPSADIRLVAVLVAGLLVSFLLCLGGDCVLHASAVELGGAAVAFAGPSGSGKSTLAALLCSHGARVITDDVLRLGLGPPLVCVGGSPQLRLRRGAAWVLDGFDVPPESIKTVDDRMGVTPTAVSSTSVELSAILLPRLTSTAAAVELRRVRGAASVAQLAAVTRVAGWSDPDVLRAELGHMVAIAAQVPVVEIVVPSDPTKRATIGPALLDLFRQAAWRAA